MKSKKSYIKRFMKALRENEREEYKDIEVQVILNGEHVLEGGNYVIGGRALTRSYCAAMTALPSVASILLMLSRSMPRSAMTITSWSSRLSGLATTRGR